MTARILVADDIEANRRLLEAKLRYEYFDVDTAVDGADALEKALRREPDIVLLDLMMPRMDGMETCQRLKSDPRTEHVPVVMITALGDREDRLRCLRAGADDFLTKPVNDFQLLSRIGALTRFKLVADELRRREAGARDAGSEGVGPIPEEPARVLIVDENRRQADRIRHYLEPEHQAFVLDDGAPGTGRLDLIVTAISDSSDSSLRLCGRIRSMEATRDLPILLIAGPGRETEAVRALDLGASDILLKPIDPEELLARVRTQARRKRYMDALRRTLDHSVALAGIDALTGLHNRRHMTGRLERFVRRTNTGGGPVSLLIADLDHFKRINDTYGHDAGDRVLIAFAERLRAHVRPGDIPCRFGGEEFVVLMPDTDPTAAVAVAERVRAALESKPIPAVDGQPPLQATMSGGIASVCPPADTAGAVLKRADEALYRAKRAGRNRIASEFSSAGGVEPDHTLAAG